MVYGTSSIKRERRTDAEIHRLKATMKEVCAAERPMTVRQLYYQLVARQMIDKTQQQYQAVSRYLCQMRREKEIPYDWIADNTRWQLKPKSWRSLASALRHTKEAYRRQLWNDQDVYVEVWCESDSIAGVIYDVTAEWDVPLYALRGFGSETFLYTVAEAIAHETRPCHIYYFGDYDPSGVHIDRDAEKKLRRFAPSTDIAFERMAVTLQQIHDWDLPGKPPKGSDSRTAKFDHHSAVEIESIAPAKLREIVSECITQHIDQRVYEQTLAVEAAERSTLEQMIGNR